MSLPESKITETIAEELLADTQLTTVVLLDDTGKSILEKGIKLNNPFAFDPDKFHPSAATPTLDRFITLVAEVLADTQKREGTIASEQVSLTDEYPLERIDRFGDEIITWRLIKREPSKMSTDAKGRPQKGFGFGYRLRSPQYPDKVITVETRPVDHIIEFSCWSKRARIANTRAIWLERTLINNSYIFQLQGIDRFIWEERLADTYINVGGQALYQRPLRFFVRLSEFRIKADTAINTIALEASANENLSLDQVLFS